MDYIRHLLMIILILIKLIPRNSHLNQAKYHIFS
nr:MAG TPA: hypothetical protein [Caudoviricetes sp.]